MEDAAALPDSMLDSFSDASVDLDLMDELLSEDVWLGASDLVDLLQPGHEQDAPHGEAKTSSSYKNPCHVEAESESMADTALDSCAEGNTRHSTLQNESGMAGTSRSWSVVPRANSGPVSSLNQRLIRALSYIDEAHRDGDALVQTWLPAKKGDRQALTTYGQPFSLNPYCQRLMEYRHVSTGYQFSAEVGSGEALGLPGRVFQGKLPEWSPDVRYFSRHEYPRVNYAQRYDVRGTLGLPIFERGSRICLGVVEVVMTTEKIKYHSDLEHICTALQAVGLTSSEVLSVPRVKMKNDSYLAAVPEISAVLRAVCQVHGLPLAQTWIPCIQQGKSGSRHSNENYKDCVSTLDAACFVNDPSLSSFHEACSEHHLLRGQGVVGKAFMTNLPCFSSNVTALSKTEYPLSHHARVFRLRAAGAIRLRSINTGKADFVVEFFLPTHCLESEEQKVMLDALSVTMQHVCQSLQVVTSKELEHETILPVIKQSPSDGLCGKHVHRNDGNQSGSSVVLTAGIGVSGPEPSSTANIMDAQVNEKAIRLPTCASSEFQEKNLQGFSLANFWGRHDVGFNNMSISKCNQDLVNDNIEYGDSFAGEPRFSSIGKAKERKRTKIEKIVGLRVLQQHFAGSLKDAAQSIGVCPTTLKRICRQHGITRWPSRKIKKVGHSLRKLQVVIDSIQGVDGPLQLSSLYANFPKDGGSDHTQNETGSIVCTENQENIPESSNAKHGLFTSHLSASNSFSSSCSQTSGSSHCYSSKRKQCEHATNIPIKQEASEEKQTSMLKRSHSELELCSNQETPRTLARSQSLKSFGDNPARGSLSPSHQDRCVDGLPRVKATYGKDKIRFRLQRIWCFQELKQEIAMRFNISNVNSMCLKYLDDESEWVLLTCDADLLECIDIHRSSNIRTIKIAVDHIAYPSVISSQS